MTYSSHGARILQRYTSSHPDRVVWSPDTGWTDHGHTIVPDHPLAGADTTGANEDNGR